MPLLSLLGYSLGGGNCTVWEAVVVLLLVFVVLASLHVCWELDASLFWVTMEDIGTWGLSWTFNIVVEQLGARHTSSQRDISSSSTSSMLWLLKILCDPFLSLTGAATMTSPLRPDHCTGDTLDPSLEIEYDVLSLRSKGERVVRLPTDADVLLLPKDFRWSQAPTEVRSPREVAVVSLPVPWASRRHPEARLIFLSERRVGLFQFSLKKRDQLFFSLSSMVQLTISEWCFILY